MQEPPSRRHVLVGVAVVAATLAPLPSAAAQKKVHVVKIKSFEFEPVHVRARPGDIIRWTNMDVVPHTATASEFGWDTETLSHGESGEIVVTTAMETTYFCVFHPHMKGTIEIA